MAHMEWWFERYVLLKEETMSVNAVDTYVCHDCGAMLIMVGKSSTATCSAFCGSKNRTKLPRNVKNYNNSIVALGLKPARQDGKHYILSESDTHWRRARKIGRELRPGDDLVLLEDERYATDQGGIYLFEKVEEK